MLDVETLNFMEQEIEALLNQGSEESIRRAEEMAQMLEARIQEQRQMESDVVQSKLRTLVEAHPWMAPKFLQQDLSKIVGENANVKSKRKKIITIATRVTDALSPYVACRVGCSDCCHMNTMIYEHEAIRLAEVTRRKMVRLAYRPINEVFAHGAKFNGKPCPFLREDRCSVYQDRPLVCRTHHSLLDNPTSCNMDIPPAKQTRPPMYDPDLLEEPYIALNVKHNPTEPWGNIAEFFPD
jgi:Fe-S-cluster containining protein